jgi:uncharacterized membrane protein (DUF373 family)
MRRFRDRAHAGRLRAERRLGGRILVEPFLSIGLIAIVRRVLVITAEVERGNTQSSDILLEIGVLGGLALVLAISIFLLRRSAPGTAEPVT